MENITSKIKAVMLGHAVGDALGVPVEFKSRQRSGIHVLIPFRQSGGANAIANCLFCNIGELFHGIIVSSVQRGARMFYTFGSSRFSFLTFFLFSQ